MKKILNYLVFLILFILLTFFGLGPVLYADGTITERIYTLIGVIVLYIILIVSFYQINKRIKK